MAAALGAAFAAAVRMVDGVHGRAADVRAAAQPALASRLAQHDAHVVGVADHADRGPAGGRHAANLAAGQIDLGPVGVAGGQAWRACPPPGRARRPGRAASRCYERPCPAESPTAAGSCPRPAPASVPLRTWSPAFKPLGGQNVALLAVHVVQQGDPGAAVRIVLDRVDHGGNAVLVAAEVDQPQMPLVAAAAMPGGDHALVVSPALALLRPQQALRPAWPRGSARRSRSRWPRGVPAWSDCICEYPC